MGEARDTKRETRTLRPSSPSDESEARRRELVKVGAEVVRLRRELGEAEARRDALIAELLAPGMQAAAPPSPRIVVVRGPFEAFVERARALRSPFSRRDARAIAACGQTALTRYLNLAMDRKLLRRVDHDRYVFASPPKPE